MDGFRQLDVGDSKGYQGMNPKAGTRRKALASYKLLQNRGCTQNARATIGSVIA